MKIFLGAVSPNTIQKARQTAPSYEFGATWTPQKMTPHDWPYIVDNGVYSAYINDRRWEPSPWYDLLRDLEDMPRDPEFVVLPDKVGDAEKTYERAEKYREKVPEQYDTALAVQDGMRPEEAIRTARDHGCTYVFIGGTMDWKHKMAGRFIMTAHDYGLKAHIARPGVPEGLTWADNLGAESVDTTSIARSRSYRHLVTLEQQTTLGDISR